MKEGDIVIITAKLPKDWPFLGTFIGFLGDKKAQVLLSNGFIFTGSIKEIYLYEPIEETSLQQ